MRLFLRFFVPFHIFVFRRTGGRVMGRFGLPVLLLTTTGRRTGMRRTAPLLYLEDRGTVLIIASNNGGPSNPDWYRNLLARPIVEVETRAGRHTMRAEPLIGAERRRRFARITAAADRYAKYQSRTSRPIPVVALREVSG
ncbi:MAG: nitroreductase family deazaflavin-dependent oxidoreductase [Chloroflexi bacterium]|nr:nitroreductase family deazaflavin-dependent oxidoreductase [Chloroflexota bacterium]